MRRSGTCTALDCLGTVGRSPGPQVLRPERLEDLCTSKTIQLDKHIECRTQGHPLTLQTVDQLADLVAEHGNENRANQSTERVAIVWFGFIHSHWDSFPLPLESSQGKGEEMDPPVEGWAPGLPPRGLVISKIYPSSKIILFHQLSILVVLLLGSKYY